MSEWSSVQLATAATSGGGDQSAAPWKRERAFFVPSLCGVNSESRNGDKKALESDGLRSTRRPRRPREVEGN